MPDYIYSYPIELYKPDVAHYVSTVNGWTYYWIKGQDCSLAITSPDFIEVIW